MTHVNNDIKFYLPDLILLQRCGFFNSSHDVKSLFLNTELLFDCKFVQFYWLKVVNAGSLFLHADKLFVNFMFML